MPPKRVWPNLSPDHVIRGRSRTTSCERSRTWKNQAVDVASEMDEDCGMALQVCWPAHGRTCFLSPNDGGMRIDRQPRSA